MVLRVLQSSRKYWIAATVLVALAIGWNLSTVKQAISQGIQTVKILSGSVTADTEFGAAAAAGDSVANPTAPYANVFLHLWNAGGSVWERAQSGLTDTDDGTVATSQVPTLVLNLAHNYDGTNWKRLLAAANALNSTGAGLSTAQIIGQFDDSSPTSITENQFGNLRMSANRNLYGTIRDAAGNERGVNVNASNAALVSQTGELPAGTQNIGDVDIASFPDNEPFNQNQRGGTAVVAGRCEREEPIYVSIDQTSGEQLATGTASERIYICSFHIVTATAQNIALVSGTGTVCATSTSGVEGFGGASAATGWNFAANGGISMGATTQALGRTDTNADNLCLLQSGAGQVSGGLTYVSLAP